MRVAFAPEFEGASPTHAPELNKAYPLVLDLDGTLLRTDLLLEALLQYVKREPLGLFKLVLWLCRGIANLKAQLAARTELAIDLLPVNEGLADYARTAADGGRTVIAATAANRDLAAKVCARFEFISDVLGSCDRVNLKGAHKARALRELFPGGYSYAGDAAADLPIWNEARFAVFGGRNLRIRDRLRQVTILEAEFAHTRGTFRDWMRALRLHQWAKNGLIFLPLLLAGHLLDIRSWGACCAAFFATGLAASATYIINDLLDLESDRQHWSKRNRPFASGTLAIRHGAMCATALLAIALGIAFVTAGAGVLYALLLYCAGTLSYSIYLKRVPVLDVVVLAALFTMRLGIGAVAAHVRLSSWLAVFSMFLFLSLALAKRSIELKRKCASGLTSTSGRGYIAADAPLVASLGASSALSAVVVLVLYLINEAFGFAIYRSPQLLWAVPILLGLWLGRVWLLCGRGSLNDDPVAFAVSDRTSVCLGLGVLASFGAAALVG